MSILVYMHCYSMYLIQFCMMLLYIMQTLGSSRTLEFRPYVLLQLQRAAIYSGDIDLVVLALFIVITLYILDYRVTRFGRTITIMASILQRERQSKPFDFSPILFLFSSYFKRRRLEQIIDSLSIEFLDRYQSNSIEGITWVYYIRTRVRNIV